MISDWQIFFYVVPQKASTNRQPLLLVGVQHETLTVLPDLYDISIVCAECLDAVTHRQTQCAAAGAFV